MLDPYLLSIPAGIALLIKGGIYLYARQSGHVGLQTMLYLALLLAFGLHNIAEISHFFTLANGEIPRIAYYIIASSILLGTAIFIHFAIALTFSDRRDHPAWLVPLLVYIGFVVILALMLTTNLVVADVMRVGPSVSRVAGPLWVLYEIFTLGNCLVGIGILYHGARNTESESQRLRLTTVLLGIVPAILVGISVAVALRIGILKFNTAITLPVATTFFLMVTAYAIHQHRLFDIQFYIPGTRVRKRKTSFYRRMRNMISEIADLNSAEDVIHRVSDTLRCPVALITGNKQVLAAGNASHMAGLPRTSLASIDHIMIAREIESVHPSLHQVMKRHGIAAVVPFFPHSEHASGWLLLGDSFSNTVYTPLDFQLVEELFDKMAELFLDKMLTIRTQLADTARALRQSEIQRIKLEQQLGSVQTERQQLEQENRQLINQQPADSISLVPTPETAALNISITMLSRDRQAIAVLKNQYTQLETYAGLSSAGFARQAQPDVLLAHIDTLSANIEKKLRQMLQDHNRSHAFLFYGEAVSAIKQRLSNLMRGGIVELIEPGAKPERLARRSHALAKLIRFTASIPYPDYPLVIRSKLMRDTMDQVRSHIGFHEPVALISKEPLRAMAITRHIHDEHGADSGFVALECCNQQDWLERVESRFSDKKLATLFIEMISPTREQVRRLVDLARRYTSVRLVLNISPVAAEALGDSIVLVNIPELFRCKDDLPLLIHYYTLQYNLQANGNRYLSQGDAQTIINATDIDSLHRLKNRVFVMLDEQLQGQSDEAITSVDMDTHTLDQQVARFEADIIARALEQCSGNKSKAARQLGLKPNTLHYKIERYGLGDRDKSGK
ncbi:MAG: hypothetical protein OEZ10_00595 [Gammaproteobacteria bacterium]|nr:hypothetical protein [Gammaproteobacteria bacterium]